VCYATTTSLLSGRLPVVYCNAYLSAQTKKKKISMKIDVFSYMRAHRHASCNSGALCRDFGAIMCDTVAKCTKHVMDTIEYEEFYTAFTLYL
jgi:hypothetical protein